MSLGPCSAPPPLRWRTPTTQALSLFGVLLLAIGQPEMFRLMAEYPEGRNLTAEYPEWWRNAFTALGIALMVLSLWRSFWGV
jgi:hypothetical protein